jgi:peroxiredoxin Q/BCP
MKFFLVACLTLAVLAFFWNRGNSNNVLQAGAAAPTFKLPDQNGHLHQLPDYQGQWLVLYFYPKDDTPGCTKEACHFRDDLQQLEKLRAKVVGISVDSALSHAKFAQKYQLSFPLLADEHREIAKSYGVLNTLGVIRWAKRCTFLIAPDGKIAKVYESVDTSRHSTEIIADLKRLRAAETY